MVMHHAISTIALWIRKCTKSFLVLLVKRGSLCPITRQRRREAQSRWTEIPTPAFDLILDTQKLPVEVKNWVYVLCGRMLYELRELDHWEILLFLKGLAGCGKSTMCSQAERFFEPCDVATMSTNIEEQFGLQDLYDKYLWVCYEMRKGFKLNQAEFQSMITGEPVAVARQIQSAHQSVLESTWNGGKQRIFCRSRTREAPSVVVLPWCNSRNPWTMPT